MDGEWFEIPGPDFPEGPSSMSGYAVDPRNPENLWATNGKVLMVSRDSGCSWDLGFSFQPVPSLDLPLSSINTRIDQIVVPEAASASGTIYLALEELGKFEIEVGGDKQEVTAPVIRPHLLASTDGGKSWELRDQGLPLVANSILRTRVAPSAPNKIYMLIAGPGGVGGPTMFASENAGASWNERGQGAVAEFVVDPVDPDELWLTGGGMYFSGDGGGSIDRVGAVSPPAGPVDVFRTPETESHVRAYEYEGMSVAVTEDGGRVWQRYAAPPNVMLSLVYGRSATDIIASTHLGMWRFQAPYYWIEITPGMVGGDRPEDYEDVLDLQMDHASGSAWGYRPSGSILRYEPFNITLPPLTPSVPPDTGETTFGPDGRIIKLAPGEKRTVSYELSMPPQPTPLDVFFLLDTTVSMDAAIEGLLTGIHDITRELAAMKLDAQFGVGEYKDYPIPGYGDPVQGDFPYRLNRPIGPPDDSLVSAIQRMEASGGGRLDYPEAQLTGLYQAITGAGDPGFVEAGLSAGFRSDATKVVVHVTDAGFHKEAQHPSPPFEVVADAMRANGVLHVGLVSYGESPAAPARTDMVAMADATETFVPPGLDNCYLEGQKVPTGEPLACDLVEDARGVAEMAPAILSILRAITEEVDVSLSATKGAGIIQKISPAVHESVNVKEPSSLVFDVTYSCPAFTESSRTPVELVAALNDIGIAGVTAKVVCSPLVEVKDKVIVPPLPPVELVPAIVPPPAPPAPPAPVSQAQPQPNPNMQGAAAQQEQEQPEVALATQEDLQEEELLAFSVYERQQPSFVPLYLSAAVMTAAFSALAIRLRRATEAARVRRR